MTMTGYSELYLNDARKNLGEMIEYAVVDLGYKPDEFLDYFITSGIADKFGKGNRSIPSVCQAQSLPSVS